MKFSSSSASLLALASIVAASPTHHGRGERVIRFPLTRKSVNATGPIDINAQLTHVSNKYRQTLAAFETNTGAAHPSSGNMTPSMIKRDNGVVPLVNEGISMWYGEIAVGTPQQQFKVVIDTGSTDLFLPTVGCTTCAGHKIYDPTQSSTSKDEGMTASLAYGSGQVEGELYSDNVFLGGYEATSQSFVAASTYSPSFSSSNNPADGLAGFAFKQLSSIGKPSIIETIASSGVLPEKVFGVKLSSTSGQSELYIGGTDTNLYVGNTLTYTSVTNQGYWEVNLDAVSRKGSAVISTTASIIDTGTTLIVATDDGAAAYFNGIPGYTKNTQGGMSYYTIPCNTIDSYTPSFTFGGREFKVSAGAFNLGPQSDGSSDCLAGIASSSNFGFWIVGDVFLQNVYLVFDMGNAKVGFADLA